MSVRSSALLRPTLPAHRQIGLFTRLARRLALFSERKRLSEMPEYLLEDIGVSRSEADAEAKREIWDAPGYWHR